MPTGTKRAITLANTECESTPTELRAQQWTLTEKVVKMLVVFEEARHEDYASSAIIIPTLKVALSTDEDDSGVIRMKRGMFRSLEDRYSIVERNPLCAIPTVLDPRFKLQVFSSDGNAAHARMLLTTECEQVLTSLKVHEENPAKCHRSEVGKHSSSLWNIFDEMLTTSKAIQLK